MKIDAFTRLLTPSTPTSRGQSTNIANQNSDASQAIRAQAYDSAAVTVDRGSIESGDESRRQRVAELKQAVSQGTYKPKSEDVALAVARELFV
jgi:anti-sigma28 factor (negative regulator of flagellin synthesis)